MKVLVCGGRNYTDYDSLKSVLDTLTIDKIVHGGATGADTLAQRYAEEHEIPVVAYYANWTRHGRAAGPIRNKMMLDLELPDVVVACPGGTGTANMVAYARATNTTVIEVL